VYSWCTYINVHRLSPGVVNDGLVKPANDKVYGATCLYFDFVRYQFVIVT
jgi:hypothetical protein